ncbi:MAG: DUF6044 family protein [Cytophagales bacterium]|nr:DUF6044 family protein [Cytophagales bacterium]
MQNKPIARGHFLTGLVLLTLPYLFWLSLGEDSYMLIHDSLDSEFIYLKLLLNHPDLFGFQIGSVLPEIMNGIPRSFFRSGVNISFVFLKLLPDAYAYIVHHYVVHLVGFIGMFLFLEKYVCRSNRLLVLAISLCFGFLSYYHIQYGISIAGQPFLLYACLNILNKKAKRSDWFILFAFPFFSFLPVTLPFFIPFLTLIGLWYSKKKKKIAWHYFGALLGICLINLAVEFNLVYSMLLGKTVSHRTEWALPVVSYVAVLKNLLNAVKYTHYHAGSLFPVFILPAFLLLAVYKRKAPGQVFLFSGAIAAIILWTALNPAFVNLFARAVPFLKTFNSDRFYFLLPFLWLSLFASLLHALDWSRTRQKALAMGLTGIIFCGILWKNKELVQNARLVLNKEIADPTFRQYYQRNQFAQVKQFLGPASIEKNRFLCIGFSPNIGQYNGLKTLDSYQNNYSLEYKHQFREIIAKELEKNPLQKKYFDDWGSRCYAFSSELGLPQNKETTYAIQKLEFDFGQIKRMNGKYLLSRYQFNLNNIPQVRKLGSFSSEESKNLLYLYEVI